MNFAACTKLRVHQTTKCVQGEIHYVQTWKWISSDFQTKGLDSIPAPWGPQWERNLPPLKTPWVHRGKGDLLLWKIWWPGVGDWDFVGVFKPYSRLLHGWPIIIRLFSWNISSADLRTVSDQHKYLSFHLIRKLDYEQILQGQFYKNFIQKFLLEDHQRYF